MKKLIVLLGVVVLMVIAAAVWQYRRQREVAPAVHVIRLDFIRIGDQCRLSTKPGREVVRRGEPVIWIVANACAAEVDVAIFNFQPQDPLVDTDEAQKPGRRDRVPPNGRGEIGTRVRDDAAYGLYTYHIRLGTTDLDPEVEVVGQE